MAILQLEAARDFIMSDKLKIFNFKSEKILEFPCKDDTSNIRNVKQFIDDEESMALSDLSRIQVFWLFSALPVPDDVLVKDLLDQKAELYYFLPQLAKVQATGSGNTFILDMDIWRGFMGTFFSFIFRRNYGLLQNQKLFWTNNGEKVFATDCWT